MQCARCFFYDNDVGDEVCRRCGRAYMPEANVYLGLLLVLAGGVAWALRQLLTGSADPFIRPSLELGAWATWPASLVDHPAYGLVVGGFLAMLALAPIMTAVLYGKRGGFLLVLVEALLGPSLALAAAAALGVIVAASYTLRLRSKLASVLLGLIPSAAWWFSATAASKVEALAPALSGVVYVPPVAAVAFAALAALLLVGIGRADRWHVRWPGTALALLVAGPVLALLAFVGVDEIRYQMMLKETQVLPGLLLDRSGQFLARHPKSPRAAEVRARFALFLEDAYARADAADAVLRSSPSPPRPEKIWMELIDLNPDSPWAVDARIHMGDIAAGGGDFGLADKYYRGALDRTAGIPPIQEDPLADFSVLGDYFTIGSELKARETGNHLLAARQTALMRLALLRENRPSSKASNEAMALYFKSLACQVTEGRRRMLLKVQGKDPSGPLVDNVLHDLAMLEPAEERLTKLEALAASHQRTDGAMRAHLSAGYVLIALAKEAATPADAAALFARAQKHFEDVQKELARRFERAPEDPYVSALADEVEKQLLCVGAQLRSPPQERP